MPYVKERDMPTGARCLNIALCAYFVFILFTYLNC